MIISLRLLGFPEQSYEMLKTGEALALNKKDERRVALIQNEIGLFHSTRGEYNTAKSYLKKVFISSQKDRDLDLMAPSAMELCYSYSTSGEFIKGAEVGMKMIAVLEGENRTTDFFNAPINIYLCLCSLRGYLVYHTGNPHMGIELSSKGLSGAIELNDLRTLSNCEFYIGMLYADVGDCENTIKHLHKCIKIAEKVKWIIVNAAATSNLAYSYNLAGDLDKALKLSKKGIDIHKKTSMKSHLSRHYWILGSIQTRLGDYENAGNNFVKAENLANRNYEQHYLARAKMAHGRLLGKIDHHDLPNKEKMILDGIRIVKGLGLKIYMTVGYIELAEFYFDTGQRTMAKKVLVKATELATKLGMTYWKDKALKLLAEL